MLQPGHHISGRLHVHVATVFALMGPRTHISSATGPGHSIAQDLSNHDPLLARASRRTRNRPGSSQIKEAAGSIWRTESILR